MAIGDNYYKQSARVDRKWSNSINRI